MRALHLQNYSVNRIGVIMLQRFEKGALNLFHCNGDSLVTCYSSDIKLQSANMRIEKTWIFVTERFSLELLSHFSDGKLRGMKDY